MKTCSKCKIEKSVEEFHKQKASKDGLYYQCKECAKAANKAHYQANREDLLEYRKAYRQENREEIRGYKKIYYQENRDEVIEKNSAYTKERIAKDHVFRWVHNTRCNLSRILNGTGGHAPTLELLGCTGEEWRSHLESTFKPGMSWENYGRGESEWQIDHIAPVSSFDQENHLQQLICWNYRNTQALWSHENMAKGNKISTEGGAA